MHVAPSAGVQATFPLTAMAALLLSLPAHGENEPAPRPKRQTLSLDATVLSASYTFATRLGSHVGVGGMIGLGPPYQLADIRRHDGTWDLTVSPLEALSAGAFVRLRWTHLDLDGGARISQVRYLCSSEGCDAVPLWGAEVGPYVFACAGWERLKFGARFEVAFDLTYDQLLLFLSPLVVRWVLN